MGERMVQVDAEGRVVDLEVDPGELERAARAAHKAGGFVLCTLENPDDAEMRELAQRLRLHPLAARDAATGRQQPKIQSYPEHLFVVMWTIEADKDFPLGQVFLFIRHGLLVCVQRGAEELRLDVETVAADRELDLGDGVMAAAYRIMSAVAGNYAEVEGAIEAELERIETEVFDEQVREDSAAIYRLRQKIGKVERAVATFATALDAGREHLEGLVIDSDKLGPYLRDLRDDVAATATLAADQSRAVDGIASTHENNVAMRQNADMRKISAIAALLVIPTVIASVYGMNFRNLPLLHWELGWVTVTLVIVALDVVAFWLFKRRQWL